MVVQFQWVIGNIQTALIFYHQNPILMMNFGLVAFLALSVVLDRHLHTDCVLWRVVILMVC